MSRERGTQEYTIEQPQSDVCGACAVRANDPFVKVTFGKTGDLLLLMQRIELKVTPIVGAYVWGSLY